MVLFYLLSKPVLDSRSDKLTQNVLRIRTTYIDGFAAA